MAGDRGETQAHHGVTGGGGEIGVAREAADVGQTVRRARSEAAPHGEIAEIFRSEIRKVARDGFGDAGNAFALDRFVHAAELHRTADAQGVAHGSDGDAGLGENRTELRQLAGLGERDAVTLAGLQRKLEAETAHHGG